jgi:hypothetical protein
MSGRIPLAALLAITLAAPLSSCVSCDSWIEAPPPPPPEPPAPARFQGATAPALEPTEVPGLLAAPSLDPSLYYYEPARRWFRFHRNRWYEAFLWDGYWFPPEEVPPPLRAGPLSGGKAIPR